MKCIVNEMDFTQKVLHQEYTIDLNKALLVMWISMIDYSVFHSSIDSKPFITI